MAKNTEEANRIYAVVADYRQKQMKGRIIDLVPFGQEWIKDFVRVRNAERNLYFFNQESLLTEESQMEWYLKYLKRQDDLFWCILDKKGRFLGSVRLYDIDTQNSSLNHGSFMIDAKVADEAPYALEAELMSLDFAFSALHVQQVINENRYDNKVMNNLSASMGFVFVKDTCIGGVPYKYHLLYEDAYKEKRPAIERIVAYWAKRLGGGVSCQKRY
jgi:RimJ/RimL family protein N-acetyltransferase